MITWHTGRHERTMVSMSDKIEVAPGKREELLVAGLKGFGKLRVELTPGQERALRRSGKLPATIVVKYDPAPPSKPSH